MESKEHRDNLPPGLRWGPFTLRIPLLHARVEWPELIQGLVVAGATGLAVVPLFMEYFGMTREIAVALVVVQSVLLCSSPIVFGEPFCPGWLTPALPLVLAAAVNVEGVEARVEFVTAVVLTVAALFLFFGLTGLGPLFLRWIPRSLKAGIILGAGLSALLGEFRTADGSASRVDQYPVTITVAAGITLLLLFSLPLERLKARHGWLAVCAGLGMAPGFIVAMVLGPFVGEVSYRGFVDLFIDPQTGDWQVSLKSFFYWPDFAGMWSGYSPLAQGMPEAGFAARTASVALQALPLAVAAYIIGFGDIVTAKAILRSAREERPEDPIPFDDRRTHLSMGVRNALQACICGPFFPLQGIIWTGAMVVVAERYRRGRKAMQSIFSGIFSYYAFGLPVLFFFRPFIELYSPVLKIALSLTLLLTGFACAYVALALPRNRVERGVMMVTAVLVYVSTSWGLFAGLLLAIVLLGRKAWSDEEDQEIA